MLRIADKLLPLKTHFQKILIIHIDTDLPTVLARRQTGAAKPFMKSDMQLRSRHFKEKFRRASIALMVGVLIVATTTVSGTAQSQSSSEDVRPYDNKLYRLSEILGAVHYLRGLCGANEGQLWRRQMEELLKTEGTSAIRRVKLVKNFNKGYRSFRRTYRHCTNSATVVLDRFMTEGTRIAKNLVNENK